MRNVTDRSGTPGAPRRLDVARIKLIIVLVGAGLSALISSLTGITPQASFAPMIGWMLGFSPAKSQATAIRVTAGTAIACVMGVLWRSSIMAVIAPGTNAPLTQIHVAQIVPSAFALTVAMLFAGSTIGAILGAKATPRPEMVTLRRAFLFSGVCIGVYVAAEGAHFSSLDASRTPLITGPAAFLLLGCISGALTKVFDLASGVILVPILFYAAGLSIEQAILASLMVIGLAALLPAWSYHQRGIGDTQYAAAGLVGGIGFGFLGSVLLEAAPARLLLMLFGLMAMFFSAREISIIAAAASSPIDSSDKRGESGPE